MNNKYASLKNAPRKQSGFTLIELIIVVVILGILGAMAFSNFSSSATSTATATQYYNLANQGTRSWSQMVAVSGSPRSIAGNPVFESGNDLLDMLVAGEEVISNNYMNAYRRAGLAGSEAMVQIVNYPSAGSRGEYRLGTVEVTVEDGDDTGYLHWVFNGVSQEAVSSLVDQHEPSIENYSLGSPVTAGQGRIIRATSGTGGLMNLTIVTRVQ